MSPTTEQLRARMAAELDELGPMPDVSARAARAGGRIVRRRRIAAGSLAGVAGVGACSLLGAVAAGALPGSGGRIADHSTPSPVPSPRPPTTSVPSPPMVPEPSPRPPVTSVPSQPPATPLPSLPAPTTTSVPSPPVLPEPSPRPPVTSVPTPAVPTVLAPPQQVSPTPRPRPPVQSPVQSPSPMP
jgi:hypothetical protein